MTVAALIISILALLVSGAALAYSHRADTREGARRHSERAPQFVAAIETMNPGSDLPWYRLLITVTAFDGALDAEVDVLDDRKALVFTPDQDGVDPASRPPRAKAHTVAPLRVGDRASWMVSLDDGDAPRPERVSLRVTATASGEDETWASLIDVEVPPPPRVGRLLV